MKLLITTVAGIFLFTTTAFANAGTVVFVDMQKAVQATKAGASAKKDLETEFNSKKKKLQAEEEKLKKMQEELEKKAMVLSDEVRGKKQAEFQEAMMSYQKLVAQSQQDIQKRERDLTQPILDKMAKVIETMSKEKNYSIVLEKAQGNILYGQKDADITDQVIAAFEKAK